jgi:hypothetical protein
MGGIKKIKISVDINLFSGRVIASLNYIVIQSNQPKPKPKPKPKP